MSDSQDDDDVRAEIQKLLKQINVDMNKLKNEITSMHSLVEENASLPVNVKMVNEKLMIAAKEAGIDLENIENVNDLEEDEESNDIEQSNDIQIPSTSNTDSG